MSDSPKITVSIGLNLPVTEDEKGRFNRITPTITIGEINPNADVKEQLRVCEKAIEETWDKVSELIEKAIEKEIEIRVKKLGEVKGRK
jgi:hypothetical protein